MVSKHDLSYPRPRKRRSLPRQAGGIRQTPNIDLDVTATPGRGGRFSPPPREGLLITYPQGGGLASFKSGRTSIDLIGSIVREPAGSNIRLNLPRDLQGIIKSVAFVLDQEALIAIDPSQGVFTQAAGYPSLITGVGMRNISVIVQGGTGARGKFVFSAHDELDPIKWMSPQIQERWTGGDVISSDAFTGVKFVPPVDPALNVGVHGNVIIVTEGYKQKTFIVQNTGAVNAVRVRLTGRMMSESTASVYVDSDAVDPQTGYVTLSPSEFVKLETFTPWYSMQCQLRSDTSGQTSTVSVEYKGQLT